MKGLKQIMFMAIAIIMVTSNFLSPFMQTFASAEDTTNSAVTSVTIHYQPAEDNTKDWNLWIWPKDGDGQVFEFSGEDEFGLVAEVDLQGIHNEVGFIVRTDSWEKDGGDRFIDVQSGNDEVWVKGGDENTYTSPPDGEYRNFPSFEKVKVKLHYFRYDGNYEGWNLWTWPYDGEGKRVDFTSEDDFGKVAEFELEKPEGMTKSGFIVRKSADGNDWAMKEFGDRYITKFDEEGNAEIWVVQGTERIYYNPAYIDTHPRILNAAMDGFNQITLETNFPFEWRKWESQLEIENAEIKEVVPFDGNKDKEFTNKVKVKTENKLDFNHSYRVFMNSFGEADVTIGKVVRSEEFDEAFYYDGELGNQYSKEETFFRLWAPTASEAVLVMYDSWDDQTGEELPLEKGEKGTWSTVMAGDQNGLIYNYKVKISGEWTEATDPYVRSVTVNGDRGVVMDLDSTDPDNWNSRKPKLTNPEDSIIYEVHVRDLSIHEDSGIENKGKFLGAAEKNTVNSDGVETGLNHIKDLGVTHVQFLPIYDYRTVDETKLDEPQFNWGYDPKNYNVPEGSYSTDPYNPASRIKELKTMVQELHNQQLRVVMDVVYNHVFAVNESSFHKLVPGYYFRYNEDGTLANGTGVGNDTASERKMVEKFIVDSVTYWAKEYNLDGFRFDLMGIHDSETMNAVRDALDKIDPSIITIGEGWDLNTPLSADRKANQKNAEDMPGIGHFNDGIRDGLKGSVFNELDKGFVNGKEGMEEFIQQGIAAGMDYAETMATYKDPEQVVTYVEAHDNHTLWDKLELTNPDATEEERKKMHKLASAIILTSQGVSFVHAGQEFMRTKYGDHNSYKSPDSINQLDWDRRADFSNEVGYFKGLVTLRKHYESFRMTTAEDIQSHLKFLEGPENTVAYSLDASAFNDKANELVVVHNANEESVEVTLHGNGPWHLLADGNQAGVKTLKVYRSKTIEVPALTSFVLKR
ncbi:type I pullulanase [Aeromicrobium ponti]|uniref:pullulanase n=2 Tax=Cytobacillus oceanisediminis TaxID=665099 RepID=A0A562K1A2_9BACI|nr:pullulanase [Cytobacillus oceanisediminis]